MADRIVINTSPLIALGKMEAFDVIAQLPFEFFCPTQVKNEIETGAAQGYAVSVETERVRLLVFDPQTEEVVTWIDWNNIAPSSSKP